VRNILRTIFAVLRTNTQTLRYSRGRNRRPKKGNTAQTTNTAVAGSGMVAVPPKLAPLPLPANRP
jgi:hypothetical protein